MILIPVLPDPGKKLNQMLADGKMEVSPDLLSARRRSLHPEVRWIDQPTSCNSPLGRLVG